MSTLETLHFDNLALKTLPIDPEERNYVRTVHAACFSKVIPTPVDNPKLVGCSSMAMSLLDLPQSEMDREEFVDYFSGNKILPGSEPAAHCYCGHQFGYFSGQLGDGAAIYLGEVINKKNERWEIQLKGAGLTPYSRTADGRKVLRSSLREFLCSEAMHFLGIPTSRAGTCITSDSKVIRDQFYDGHPKEERCSIVLRIAPTFIRFGSFEIFRTLSPFTGRVGPSVGRTEILHTLLNYVIETFYPEVHGSSKDQEEKYAAFFKEVVLRTARLVALWQSVGFCHGVLNTDNMSIVGITLDYGPFGFLDVYDPNHLCNASDEKGRYSFIKQPEICLWNLKMLAEAIEKALPLSVSLPILELYEDEFQSSYIKKMRAKLGIIASEYPEDKVLVEELFDTMENTGADFTNTFLSFLHLDTNDSDKIDTSLNVVKENLLENCYSVDELKKFYATNLNSRQIETFKAIAMSIQEAESTGANVSAQINFLAGHLSLFYRIQKSELFEDMTDESKRKRDSNLWSSWLKKYVDRVGKDLESFKGDAVAYNNERLGVMKNNNPKLILRNYIAEETIELAEKGDYSLVQKLVAALEDPYNNSYSEVNKCGAKDTRIQDQGASSSGANISEIENIYDKPPQRAFSLKVS